MSLADRLESCGAFCGFPKLRGVSWSQLNVAFRLHRLSGLISTSSTSLLFLATKWIAKPQEKSMIVKVLFGKKWYKKKALPYKWTHSSCCHLRKAYIRSSQLIFQQGGVRTSPALTSSWEAMGIWWLLEKGESVSVFLEGVNTGRLPMAQWWTPCPWVYGQH